jgi:hypothetical protein
MHSDKDNISGGNNSARNPSPVQRPHGNIPGSLGAIMQNFQSVPCRKINNINKTPGRKLLQRNYWEPIIRNDNELNQFEIIFAIILLIGKMIITINEIRGMLMFPGNFTHRTFC